MITGNKGEWSEIYTLFKLLGDKILQPGDENITKIKNVFYPIIKILRAGINGNYEYSIHDDIVLISGTDEILKIPIQEFKDKSLSLLNLIKQNKKTTFSIPEIEQFMLSINCISLKANSDTKTDITIVVHDQRINQQPTLGFSIKSQLGNPSTLLNAGKTTNFIYKVNNLNIDKVALDEINAINTKSKIKDRIESIFNKGGSFEFIGTEQKIFSNNLVLIDSLLPQILAEIVRNFYSSNSSKIIDLVANIEMHNPLHFDISNKHQYYNYKTKRLLTDIALGMMPSKVWSGEYDATGGYLIVKEDGEILCYHIYNRNQFEDYLINNTKLETASSTRHDFGTIYEENGVFFFKLNLQIRFVK
jgi:type II restriction enzyme